MNLRGHLTIGVFALAVLLAVVVLLSGCQRHVWVQPGVSQIQTDRDSFDCENQVLREYGGWRNVEPFTAAARIQECMRVRGYQHVPIGSASASRAPASVPPEAANDYRDDPTCRRPNGQPCGTP